MPTPCKLAVSLRGAIHVVHQTLEAENWVDPTEDAEPAPEEREDDTAMDGIAGELAI